MINPSVLPVLRSLLVVGDSMFPIINNLEHITVCKMKTYSPGDILAFQYKGNYLIHRLLKIENGIFFAKGDNSFRIEDFSEDAILGKAIIPQDYNCSERFLISSWNIGILFKKSGYQKDLVINTKEYLSYKREYIDSVFAKKQVIRTRDAFSYSSIPLPLNTPYAIIKGEPLSLLAYGKCGQRLSHDIDLLVPKQSLEIIENLFMENGFEKVSSDRIKNIFTTTKSHQTIPVVKKTKHFGNVLVDLNFDVFWGEYEGKRIDIVEFLSDCIEVDIYGVKVKTLPPTKAMISLALHHYKDMNSLYLLATKNTIHYLKFQEIYCLLINNRKEITVDALYATSIKYNALPYVYYILYYTYQVFNDPILKSYLKALHTVEGEQLLNQYGLCSKEQKEWKVDFQTRLKTNNLFSLIQDDLTESDFKKIQINKELLS